MAEFTQGTWIHNPETAITSAHNLTANGKDTERPVAVVLGAVEPNPAVDNAEAFANARLIENAPAMFEMLEYAESALCGYEEDYGLSGQISELLEKIRADSQEEDEPRKSCPFCGCVHSNVLHFVPEEKFCIECSYCKSSTCLYDTREEAIDAWNTREADNDE